MLYSSNRDPVEIAKLVINIETGFMYFEDGVFTAKPKQINILENSDASSTVIIKHNFGNLFLPEQCLTSNFYKVVQEKIKFLIEQHPALEKIYNVHYPINLSGAVGYTSLKIKFDGQDTISGNREVLKMRSFNYTTPADKSARFNWMVYDVGEYLHRYLVSEDDLTKRVLFSSSILIDDGIFNEPDGLKLSYNITTKHKFTICKLNKACEIYNGRSTYEIIAALMHIARFIFYINVPVFDNIEVSDIKEDLFCLACKIPIFEKYYIMVYAEDKHQFCKYCVHKATQSTYIGNIHHYLLCYDKPDKILIADIASSFEEIIRKLPYDDNTKDFLIDYHTGEKRGIMQYRYLVGKKKWFFGSEVLYNKTLSNAIFTDDNIPVVIVI